MLISETADIESTYHMYLENSRSGVMKRSGMDVDVISDGQTLPVYSVSRVLSTRTSSIQSLTIDSLCTIVLCHFHCFVKSICVANNLHSSYH